MNKKDYTKSKIIAVDFDGTIVEDAYPKIGKPKIFAFETLKQLQNDGHRLILWTYRYGEKLNEAIEFCKKNGIVFDAINNNFHGEEFDINSQSRKIHAEIFIDDRNVGGFLGWGEIYVAINENKKFILNENSSEKKQKKKNWFF